MTTYRLDVVVSGLPDSPPLATRTFEAINDFDATTTARRYTRDLVTNPEGEHGELYAVEENQHVADIDLSEDR